MNDREPHQVWLARKGFVPDGRGGYYKPEAAKTVVADISIEDCEAEGIQTLCPFGICNGEGYVPQNHTATEPNPCKCSEQDDRIKLLSSLGLHKRISWLLVGFESLRVDLRDERNKAVQMKNKPGKREFSRQVSYLGGIQNTLLESR